MIKCERCGSDVIVKKGVVRCSNQKCVWHSDLQLTRENVNTMLILSLLFEEKVTEIADLNDILKGGRGCMGEFVGASVNNGSIDVRTKDFFNDNEYFYTFSFEYLFDDEWQKKVRAEIETKRIAEEKAHKEHEEKMKLIEEERERQEYFRLGAKFGFLKSDEVYRGTSDEVLRDSLKDIIDLKEEGERK